MPEGDGRARVRAAFERHMGLSGPGSAPPVSSRPSSGPAPSGHPASSLYLTLVNTTDDCVIEPSVRCNHGGYCKTHGY